MKRLSAFSLFLCFLLAGCGLGTSTSNSPHPILGAWKMNLRGNWNIVTINADSSFREAIDYSETRWRYLPEDQSIPRPAMLVLRSNEPDGTGSIADVTEYRVVTLNDTTMELQRMSDSRTFFLSKSPQEYKVSKLNSLVGIFERSFLMPIAPRLSDKLLHDLIPDLASDRGGGEVLLKGNYYVLALNGYSGITVAVFNPETEELLSYENFEGVPGECSVSLSVLKDGTKDIIEQRYGCNEGDPTYKYFEVSNSGKLLTVDYIKQPDANTWATSEPFAHFAKKWFPLFEGADGLERRQLCGGETFLEVIASGNGYTWREQGYQEVWEATVQDFVASSEAADSYIIKLRHETGAIREVVVAPNPVVPGTKLIDSKLYTRLPDEFKVNNDTQDCP